jgi:SnoaL-like polyketide cyclase
MVGGRVEVESRLMSARRSPVHLCTHSTFLAPAVEEAATGRLGFLGSLPDLYAAEQDVVAENDLVMVRLVVTATVKGQLLGVPADGRTVRWDAVDIYRVTDGRISEEWLLTTSRPS